MHLDGLTLMIAGSFISGVGTLLLWGAWLQMRPAAPAIRWWAIAYALNAIAVAVLAAGFASRSELLIAVGSSAVPLAATAIWTGARAFHRRSLRPWTFAAVPALWLAAGFLPLPGGHPAASTIATLALSATLLAAACAELIRGRAERLGARWPLTAIIALHAAIFAGGVVDVLLGNVPTDTVPPLTSWFSLIHFEQMIFLLGSAVFMVMMCRERQEASFQAVARTDSLTGVANRGAFFTRAERIHRRAREDGAPVSLIVFDIDNFKQTNDTHGHAVGDRVLRAFAETANATLRPIDLFGRIGGDEFAAILPGAGIEAAYVIADRVRHAFAAVPKGDAGSDVQATVSGGVTMAAPGAKLEALLEAADRALYRAKALGRNRVERDVEQRPGAAESNVIRVA